MVAHKVKLNELIENNATYEEILKESQILDEFINKHIESMISHSE